MRIRLTFAELCRNTRLRVGRTQRQLGAAVGVTHGYIAKIELGRADPSLDLVERIAHALDLEIELGLGWRPRRVLGWLLLLASDEIEGVLRANDEVLSWAFPVRARAMSSLVAHGDEPVSGHGLALIDPARKRAAWLMSGRVDGRRSPAPYTDY